MEDPREPFGYTYFDAPQGCGYRGYDRDGNGDGTYLPWREAQTFCQRHGVTSAVDLGCAKGFLVAELRDAGIDATGYDVSDYALAFADGLPCYRADVRDGIPHRAEAVFALGVLVYLAEDELPDVLADIHRASDRFLLLSNYYSGDPQEVPDPHRRTTRPYAWWRAQLAEAGFIFTSRERCFDVYTV